jgi:Family of unknown function (DUF5677)
MTDNSWFDEISGFLDKYIDDVNEAVSARNGPTVPIDTYHPHVPSVLAGLLARQATLTTRLAQCPPLWDGHSAPLLLRPMVESLVTFRWIIIDPVNRANEYICYGLGQAKLQLAKLQAELETMEDGPAKERAIWTAQMQEAWILSQRLIQFVDVNLGSWTGSSVRQMCIETDDKELYDWWFAVHSACVHNTWQHVAEWNTKTCKNPLHQEHRLSHVAAPTLTLDYVHQSAKFFSAFVEDFDTYYGIERTELTILESFESNMYKLAND